MLDIVNNNEIDLRSTFFSDEAWFHLHGNIACQNNRYDYAWVSSIWCKKWVWCAINIHRIIGQFCLKQQSTVRGINVDPLCDKLTYAEHSSLFFSRIMPQPIFQMHAWYYKLISKNVWPLWTSYLVIFISGESWKTKFMQQILIC